MSYQRWTEGDAYVIGTGDPPAESFYCVACDAPHHRTYADILRHLRAMHRDSAQAIARLEAEQAIVGPEASWGAYLKDQARR